MQYISSLSSLVSVWLRAVERSASLEKARTGKDSKLTDKESPYHIEYTELCLLLTLWMQEAFFLK